MPKNLVIVESPHKTGPIGNYLGKDYKVVASVGHIRDLSTKGKYGFGVDVDNNFKPDYVTIKGKKKVIDDLKKEAKKADFVYLATDPDREGEAISWHLYDALGLKENNYERVVFNEITKNAVVDAFNHSRKIDTNLVIPLRCWSGFLSAVPKKIPYAGARRKLPGTCTGLPHP